MVLISFAPFKTCSYIETLLFFAKALPPLMGALLSLCVVVERFRVWREFARCRWGGLCRLLGMGKRVGFGLLEKGVRLIFRDACKSRQSRKFGKGSAYPACGWRVAVDSHKCSTSISVVKPTVCDFGNLLCASVRFSGSCYCLTNTNLSVNKTPSIVFCKHHLLNC